MEITLESLGLTKEQLAERIVEGCVERFLGDDNEYQDTLYTQLDKKLKVQIDATIDKLFQEHVAPGVTKQIEEICFQQTNQWGEKTGQPAPIGFTEYLTKRVDAYIQEPLSFDGKTKAQDSYNWSAKTTRIAFMMEKHLHYHIQSAIEAAMKDANSSIAGGILNAVKFQLNEVLGKLKITASNGRG